MKENAFFPEIRGNFGFGCMRLPMLDDKTVDTEQFGRMADAFIAAGFNYFDTAHGYLNGLSETAIAECVAGRYDRSRFLLTDKLTAPYFNSQEEIRPFFEMQLKACGVDYFDFYLMHSQSSKNYPKFKELKAYETAYAFKQEGLIRHFGISFHDKPEVLDMILTEHPEIEIVQIQFNYIDYDEPSVAACRCYEVCEKHGKPVIVMEPVKGGNLVKLPPEADGIFRALGKASNASYAIRFAAGFPQMAMVLSGMSDMAQMEDNLRTMKDFKPLDEVEKAAVNEVCRVFRDKKLIPCTGCRYCVEENHCPMGIRIPDMFASLNTFETFHSWALPAYYRDTLTAEGHGKASECIGCGGCEAVCPQQLEIRKLLNKVAEAFEKQEE